MTATAIEWTTDVWNPTTGCDRVSPGCDHCYALTMAKRLKGMGSAKYQRDGDPRTSGPGFGITEHESSLDAPLHWRKPRRVFVNSMSDLFHAGVSDEFIARVWAVMAATPQHTYQILTKRHGRMRSLLSSNAFDLAVAEAWERLDTTAGQLDEDHTPPYPLPNVWLGVSVEDQKRADLRIPALLNTPAAVRFLSCEPLLGPVELRPAGSAPSLLRGGEMASWRRAIDWVIAGGESGPGARPMHPNWARQLRDQCQTACVPFFFKQWGEWSPMAPLDGGGRYDFSRGHTLANDGTLYEPAALAYEPEGPRYREALSAGHDRAALTNMYRVGKKVSGRELDGRTWDEFPAKATGAAA